MAATLDDFKTGIQETPGKDLCDQWPPLVRSVQALTCFFQSKFTVGTEPDDTLRGLAFGDDTGDPAIFQRRLWIDAGTNNLEVQQNTGTDASPVWVTQQVFDGGAVGEANTASNRLTDTATIKGLFFQKDSVDLEFKNIEAGTNVTLGVTDDKVTINAAGGSFTTEETWLGLVSANVSSAAGFVALSFAAGSEVRDDGNWHNDFVNPSRITVVDAGLYHISAGVEFPVDSLGNSRGIQLRRNGGGGNVLKTLRVPPIAVHDHSLGIGDFYHLGAADYIELLVQQDSGSILAIGTGSDTTFLKVVRVA